MFVYTEETFHLFFLTDPSTLRNTVLMRITKFLKIRGGWGQVPDYLIATVLVVNLAILYVFIQRLRGIATDSGKISYAFFNLDRSLSWYF
jgi:hypothetical protein